MTFKTNLPPASCPALTGFSVLQVEGRDAAAFLQAQTMNDAAGLAAGTWQWNGWLTPKGRVLALFALLRLEPDRFWLVLPDLPASELQPMLQRFVFRSKLVLSADPGVVAAAGPVLATPAPAQWAGDFGDGMVLDLGSQDHPRCLHLLPAAHPALAAADTATDLQWLAADLAFGLPRLPAGQREAWTPQMLSLDRLGAYSLKKGCYPGQEIVARTHYLGKSKRRLLRLAGQALTEGASVESGAGPAGTVVSALADGSHALAVVGADESGNWSVNGLACNAPALLPGLNRTP